LRLLTLPPQLAPDEAWSLRQENDARNHRHGNYRGGHWPAKCQPAMIHRFVEEVAQGRPKWSRENERSPEHVVLRHQLIVLRRKVRVRGWRRSSLYGRLFTRLRLNQAFNRCS